MTYCMARYGHVQCTRAYGHHGRHAGFLMGVLYEWDNTEAKGGRDDQG